MKTVIRIIISLAVILMMAGLNAVDTAEARGGGHGGHGGFGGHGPRVGIGFWVGPGWGWPYYPSYYYPYYYQPETVVIQQPEVYVQPAPVAQQPVYWYYCKNPQGYYPYIKECPDGWMKVVPTPPVPSTVGPE